jgi:DNA-binding NtrC family response regulator/tetratricopeptide (TPR) repeat protein
MGSFVPERFAVIRTFREDRSSKTFLADDHLLGRENVIVRIVRKDCIHANRQQLLEHFSWVVGVKHSLFATVLDAGLTKRQDLYYVREFLPSSGLFSVDASLWIPYLVAAIDFLHCHGRIHGAIRPSNIFSANENFKISDARPGGLKLVEGEESVHFTAPEILRGAPVSLEGDLYSIGAVLYRGLTGRHLFEDSEVNRLRSKYLSACPQPASPISVVSYSIAQLALGLLSRDPADRRVAFGRLKRLIPLERFESRGMGFIGRERELQQVMEVIQRPTTLRVVLLEGEVGIGKTRLLEEIRLHCGFRGYTFVSSQRTQNCLILSSPTDGLCRSSRNAAGPNRLTLDLLKPGQRTSPPKPGEHPKEKTISDMISSLADWAVDRPTVVALDDVNFADDETVLFFEQLAFRASDVPLTLLLLGRPVEVQPKWTNTFARCLPKTNFHLLRLPPLSGEESKSLVEFLEIDCQIQSNILNLAGGNPLFICEYAYRKESLDAEPPLLAQAASAMLSSFSQDRRDLLEVLSVLAKPITIELLASLSGRTSSHLYDQLDIAARLGLVRTNHDVVEIKFPLVRNLIYTSLTPRRRKILNNRVFVLLRDLESDNGVLGQYAFDAQLFSEAAHLYAELANNAYESRAYGVSLGYYQRLKHCRKRLGEGLTTIELLNVARCYDKTNKQRFSTRFYRKLLDAKDVQANPALLSLVCVRLVRATSRSSVKEAVRLLELAIERLPKDTSVVGRYSAICELFVFMGDLRRATQLWKERVETVLPDCLNPSNLQATKGIILLNTSNFGRAIESFESFLRHHPNAAGGFLNLGLCFESLGELQAGLEHYVRAQEIALAATDLGAQAASLNNIAAIKTKLGQIHEAARLFSQALTMLRNLNTQDNAEKENLLSVIEADTAMNAICCGDYALAQRFMTILFRAPVSMPCIDRLSCQIAKCKFLLKVGLNSKIQTILEKLEALEEFNGGFVRIERALIEAYLVEIQPSERLKRLQTALQNSNELGTLYQQCELQIAIGSVHLELDEKQNARQYLKQALELANTKSYRLLVAQALLFSGIASEEPDEKQQFLSEAFEQASDMGLQEIVAESAYHIGILNLESGNTMTAREYLIRSTSITARLAEGVPTNARSKYLSKNWRRDAVRAMERCNDAISVDVASMFNTEGERYFASAYRFTMATATATSVEGLLASIEKTFSECFLRSAVITINGANESRTIPIKVKISPELSERIQLIRSHARNRVYFESLDQKGKQPIGWIPMKSETYEGGIYLGYRPHETPFTEKEIELLTMMGTIASSALKRLETRQAYEEESRNIFEFHGILGASKSIKEVYSQIQMASGNTATVLIEGESGTGKELVARAIHAAGTRAKEPFIAVDCGAIPEGLIEAELFGAKKGSYTGAVADRSGLFEAANKGTLFLDEISNTTPILQAKLLRAIQERKVRRIGETKDRMVDVRLIVASNRGLESLAQSGEFRKDLLYRLKVLHIRMPALRDRRDDIPMLAHAFLQRLNTANKTKKCFAIGVVDQLCDQDFPGNVRELQNVIERAFFMAKGIVITEIPVETTMPKSAPPTDEVQTWFEDIKEGRKDFWADIHTRYKRRDISREKVVAFVDFGLRSTRGSYATMASMFRLKEKEYRRFMDFLRRSDYLLDFRPYRKAATAS